MNYNNKRYPEYYRDVERNGGYMYYPNGNSSTSSTSGSGSTSYYTELPYDMKRDPR